MSRLIDADKLKVYLKEYLHYEHAIPWVDAQPTAYDVSRVVAELEEMPNRESDYYYAHSNDVIDREDAIDIVKRGGVE